MGEAAISRSTRQDRSRDPLYNQMKMYTELFRSLGWLRSTTISTLQFAFTLLGRQVVEAKQDWRPLLGETALGIAYPSHVLKVQHDHQIRPFATILQTMHACEDGLSRDEMILGPLSAVTDRSSDDIHAIASRVLSVRDGPVTVSDALAELSDELGIKVNSMKNYTRWPLAVMQSLGWTSKQRKKGARPRREVHRLTALGKQTANRVALSVDIRADQVDRLSPDQRRSLAHYAHFSMLDRSGFEITSSHYGALIDKPSLREAMLALGVKGDRPVLYSPFQSLTIEDLEATFPSRETPRAMRLVSEVREGPVVGRGSRRHLFVAPIVVDRAAVVQGEDLDELTQRLKSARAGGRTLDAAARGFARSRERDTQEAFYPLVAQLFRILGFPCSTSRKGVNYQRWDASATLCGQTARMEIKSPTEEMYLSTKAVRQAIENKVILLARGESPTTRKLTSLIVGYRIPNERGELASLIEDVHRTFGFNIGVLDLQTLVALAMRSVTDSVSIDEEQLSTLRGFLSV